MTMINFPIILSGKIKPPDKDDCIEFHQRMINRWLQGHVRYGSPNRDQRYLTKLKKELKKYEETGNAEHLYNIANYAYLESKAHENPKHHYDPNVGSVTRK